MTSILLSLVPAPPSRPGSARAATARDKDQAPASAGAFHMGVHIPQLLPYFCTTPAQLKAIVRIMERKHAIIRVILFLLVAAACAATLVTLKGQLRQEVPELILAEGNNTVERFLPPPGYTRVELPEDSFGAWLRRLPLQESGTPIRYRDGGLPYRQNSHAGVFDIETLRYQQCADGVIRLWAEYLWSQGRQDEIGFHFTSGDFLAWKDWSNGLRAVVLDDFVEFLPIGSQDHSRSAFHQCLVTIFTYAGTKSLPLDAEPVAPQDLAPGDFVLRAGSPGHTMLILDMAINEQGERVALLGQSFIPAVTYHVIMQPNSDLAPWFPLSPDMERLITPWYHFSDPQLLRFTNGNVNG